MIFTEAGYLAGSNNRGRLHTTKPDPVLFLRFGLNQDASVAAIREYIALPLKLTWDGLDRESVALL